MSSIKRSFIIFAICFFSSLCLGNDKQGEYPELRVGVLKFGTINWEMAIIKQQQFDTSRNFKLQVIPFASKNAAAVALQGNAVDVILTDIFWVAKQRSLGKHYQITPTHKANGGIVGSPSETPFQITDLIGASIGIGGGSSDKSWLVLQLLARLKNVSLTDTDIRYATPPLLHRMTIQNKVDFSINFWHYNARALATKKAILLPVSSMLKSIDIEGEVPIMGWVANETFAQQNKTLFKSFIQASLSAKRHLLASSANWQTIKHLTKAENDAVFEQLIRLYPDTLLSGFNQQHKRRIQVLLNKFKHVELDQHLGNINYLPDDIYWQDAYFTLESDTQ